MSSDLSKHHTVEDSPCKIFNRSDFFSKRSKIFLTLLI
jgi:hypothetical protein